MTKPAAAKRLRLMADMPPYRLNVGDRWVLPVLLAAVIGPLLAVIAAFWLIADLYPTAAYVHTDRFCPGEGRYEWLAMKRCYFLSEGTSNRPGVVHKFDLYDIEKLPLAEYRARTSYFTTILVLLAALTFVLAYALNLVRELDPALLDEAGLCVGIFGAFILVLVAAEHSWLENAQVRHIMRPVLKLLPSPFAPLPAEGYGHTATAWGLVGIIRNVLHVVTVLAFTACAALAACCWLTCPGAARTRDLAKADTLDPVVPRVARSVSRLRLALYLMALMMGFSIIYMHAYLGWPLSLYTPETAIGREARALADTLILYWSVAFTAAIAAVYVPIAYVVSRRVEQIIAIETRNLPHADALAWPAKNGLVFSVASEVKALIAMFVPIIAGIAGSSIKGLIG